MKGASNGTRLSLRGHMSHPLAVTMAEAKISEDAPIENIPDIMNPATFVAPDSQLVPSITIEFCDRVCFSSFRSLADLPNLLLSSVAGEHSTPQSHLGP